MKEGKEDTRMDPALDGVTHVNVYNRGRTALGRDLSNFAPLGFALPDHGSFASVEGYWYWLTVPKDSPLRDRLRTLSGFTAKKLGRDLRGRDWDLNDAFRANIVRALNAKLDAHPELVTGIRATTLPFWHYYVFGDTVHDLSMESKWMLDVFDQRRRT